MNVLNEFSRQWQNLSRSTDSLKQRYWRTRLPLGAVCTGGLFLISACSTIGLPITRTVECSTQDECYRIAKAACPGGYREHEMTYGHVHDDAPSDPREESRPFGEQLAANVLSAAAAAAVTAATDPEPWKLQYSCRTP